MEPDHGHARTDVPRTGPSRILTTNMVGDTGLEPVTSSVSRKRATTAPIARGRAGYCLEVETGFEPVYAALQAVASPLGHSTGTKRPEYARASPSGRRDSNPRPSPWQGDALPAALRPPSAWTGLPPAPGRAHTITRRSSEPFKRADRAPATRSLCPRRRHDQGRCPSTPRPPGSAGRVGHRPGRRSVTTRPDLDRPRGGGRSTLTYEGVLTAARFAST